MPYYWSRVFNLYIDHPDETWDAESPAIVADLAWHFLQEDDTPEAFQQVCRDADSHEYNVGWRDFHPDEGCRFKDWIDEMRASSVTQGWRDDLLSTLLCGHKDMTSSEASSILHMAPCSVIRSFIEKTQQSIDDYYNQSEASYDSSETIIDGNLDVFEQYYPGALPASEDDDEDSMPSLYSASEDDDEDSMPSIDWDEEGEEEDEEEELRTNQWRVIRFPWQNRITPREYEEIINSRHRREFWRAQGDCDQSEPMDISDDETDTDEEMIWRSGYTISV